MEQSEADSDGASSAGRHIKGLSSTSHADCGQWPTPDEGALAGDASTKYFLRKKAITMYLTGTSSDTIRKTCNLSTSFLYRLITERCLKTHPDGKIYGWRGIIPNVRIAPYRRKHRVILDQWGHGASGAMQTLLDSHPDLRINFEKRILSSPRGNNLSAVKQPCQAHWNWFLKQLKILGYEARGDWPFNTENNGYQTVRRYIKRVFADHPDKASLVIGGPNLEKKLKSGDGVDRPINKAFQRVEMDAHKLDGRFCVMLPQMSGGYVAKIIHRIWVIVIIEIFTRVVLGYHLSFRREVGKDDVLRVLKKSLSAWQPRVLMFSENAYIAGAGYPSTISDQFVGICWEDTSIDGALAEKAIPVREALKDVVGSTLTTPTHGFSSRRSLDDRPFIETFFRKLGVYGFQRLSNTTGGDPGDKQGRNPDEIALASRFQVEYAEELLDVLIANYNATPHTSLGNRSPLEYFKFIASRGDSEFKYADMKSVESILSFRKKCRVNGGAKNGKRPFVNFMHAQYHGEILSQRSDLAGKSIWVVSNFADDVRIVQASTMDGHCLGALRAAPPWHKLPHSIEVRCAIASCLRRRMFNIASMGDAVEAFLEYVESQPNKKLPIHPAYLEARRLLVSCAEREAGKSMVNYDFNAADPSRVGANKNPDISHAESASDTQILPARRQAASKG